MKSLTFELGLTEAFVRAFGDLQIEEYEEEYEYLCMLILFWHGIFIRYRIQPH